MESQIVFYPTSQQFYALWQPGCGRLCQTEEAGIYQTGFPLQVPNNAGLLADTITIILMVLNVVLRDDVIQKG